MLCNGLANQKNLLASKLTIFISDGRADFYGQYGNCRLTGRRPARIRGSLVLRQVPGWQKSSTYTSVCCVMCSCVRTWYSFVRTYGFNQHGSVCLSVWLFFLLVVWLQTHAWIEYEWPLVGRPKKERILYNAIYIRRVGSLKRKEGERERGGRGKKDRTWSNSNFCPFLCMTEWDTNRLS